MRPVILITVVLLVSALLIGPVSSSVVHGETGDEYAVKAAFVLNFARFFQWPGNAFTTPTEPYDLCVMGNQSIVDAFRTIHGKRIGDRTIQVRRGTDPDQVGTPHLLFISSGIDPPTLFKLLGKAKACHVLTIGEVPHFAEFGGVINFLNRQGRLQFEISRRIADMQGLTPSSRLLKLAIIVDDQ
ncbi:MAG: YfiR family protein [Desulfobacteraceae bacterium]|nr:YfiR family protein [Desulfobacteraceae bacterium]